MCFLFVYSVCFSFFFYLFICSFFPVPFIGFPGFPSHPKTPTKKNEKSKIQNPDQKASKRVCPTRVSAQHVCLPNTCVCPPVCPTASSPKAQTFEPPLTIHWALCPIFFIFSCHQSCSGFFCAVHGFPITSQNANKKKRKIQNPKSRSKSVEACLPYTCVCPTRVSAHPSAQQLRPQRLKHLNPLLPFIGLFAPYFSFFPVIKAAVVFSVPFMDFPSHPKTPPKKNCESSP